MTPVERRFLTILRRRFGFKVIGWTPRGPSWPDSLPVYEAPWGPESNRPTWRGPELVEVFRAVGVKTFEAVDTLARFGKPKTALKHLREAIERARVRELMRGRR